MPGGRRRDRGRRTQLPMSAHLPTRRYAYALSRVHIASPGASEPCARSICTSTRTSMRALLLLAKPKTKETARDAIASLSRSDPPPPAELVILRGGQQQRSARETSGPGCAWPSVGGPQIYRLLPRHRSCTVGVLGRAAFNAVAAVSYVRWMDGIGCVLRAFGAASFVSVHDFLAHLAGRSCFVSSLRIELPHHLHFPRRHVDICHRAGEWPGARRIASAKSPGEGIRIGCRRTRSPLCGGAPVIMRPTPFSHSHHQDARMALKYLNSPSCESIYPYPTLAYILPKRPRVFPNLPMSPPA